MVAKKKGGGWSHSKRPAQGKGRSRQGIKLVYVFPSRNRWNTQKKKKKADKRVQDNPPGGEKKKKPIGGGNVRPGI